jgi:short-subunit dehydrogenase
MHDERTVLITGATSGIGHATASSLAQSGWRVIASGRVREDLASLSGEGIDRVVMDVTSQASIDAAREEVSRLTNGRGVDALVNCAGLAVAGPTELVSTADVQSQLDVNVLGLLAVTRAFLPDMRRRGKGRVVNIGSLAGRIAFPFMGTYSATKFMVRALTDALRVELKPFGVDVVLVEPGVVRTSFTARTMERARTYVDGGSPFAAALARADEVVKMSSASGVEPDVIVRLITRALEARRPPAQLSGPWFAALGTRLFALLPLRVGDWLLARLMRLHLVPAPAPTLPLAAPRT